MKALKGDVAKKVMSDSRGRKELGEFVANKGIREKTITLSDGTKFTVSRDKIDGRAVAVA